MTTAEGKLLGVIVFLVCTGTWAFRQDIRKNVTVFLLGCLAGFLAQLPLGPDLNRYTPNITLYVTYVSVAVIMAWGMGLASIYAGHCWLARMFKRKRGLPIYACASVLTIVILEAIGSNIVGMKLYNYTRFQSLMPALNAMHAPVWLYGYYALVALLFYCLLRALRIQTEDWSGYVGRDAVQAFADALRTARPEKD